MLALILLLSVLMPAFSAKGEEITVTAPSVLLMDSASGQVLFEKGGHEQRPAASITKVMTLLLVFEAMQNGQLTMDQTLSASAHAASMGGSDIWLKEGETMTVNDLIKATVIMSANDAAVVLAEGVSGSEEAFVARMNERAAELGMADTVFKNCNGLDEDGHLTSAFDVALMSRALIQFEGIFTFTTTWIDYLRGGETQLVNTNKLIKTYNGITGLKTGTTSKAGSCISATAKRDNMHLIAVVLGAANTDDRFKDAAALLDYGFANWGIVVPQQPPIGEIEIQGGMLKTISATAQEPPSILLRSNETSEISHRVEINRNLTAPINMGDVIGKVVYFSGDKTLAQTEVRAAQSVKAVTFSSSFLYLLRECFNFGENIATARTCTCTQECQMDCSNGCRCANVS